MADLLRISLIGELPNGEEWSVNPVWGLSDFPVSTTPAQVQAVASAIALNAIPTGFAAVWANNTRLVGVRVEARTYAGALENQAEATKAAPWNGTSGVTHPFQTASVCSLRTAAVGQSGRGRLYFPATGMLLDADTYRPAPALVSTFISGVKTILSDIETDVRATFSTAKLGVWSRKLNAVNNVTSIQAGDILDVQRRRRDTLVEAYTTLAFP